MKNVLFVLCAAFFSINAFADQCEVLKSKAQALTAVRMLNAAKEMHHFCENCGDATPKLVARYAVDLQTFEGVGSGKYIVVLNSKTIDLAYTYVDGLNLAYIVGCPTRGVSREIR